MTIIRNKARAAVVWMDEYKDIALKLMHVPPNFDLVSHPITSHHITSHYITSHHITPQGPLEYMTSLRARLQCKPFKWLLETIYPELFVPTDDRRCDVLQLRSHSHHCMQTRRC